VNSAVDYRSEFSNEVFGAPSAVMGQYLEHFENNASNFIKGLAGAMDACTEYAGLHAEPQCAEGFAWSQVHFLNAINCALISTRLFLSGYLVASGNQSRQAIESLAFGVLLPFPKTGAYREFKLGHDIEHKALQWLARNATHCGTTRANVEAVSKQAKFFDKYSHPSRLALASAWGRNLDHGLSLGAVYVPGYLPQYKKEMTNRVSLTRLLSGTIKGTQRELQKQGMLKPPKAAGLTA
jgi:hypothetical protein